MTEPTKGAKYRSPVGGVPMVVVDVDARLVYVKRHDESKRSLSTKTGAHVVGRGEFAEWIPLP